MTSPPRILADRPATPAASVREDAALDLAADGQPHDLLSELLRSVRLSGEGIVTYAPPRAFSIGFAEMGRLHIVEEGELVLRIDGDPQVKQLNRGDFALLPRGTFLPITLIAENVGYASEAAFSRALKNRYGTPPARWRRGHAKSLMTRDTVGSEETDLNTRRADEFRRIEPSEELTSHSTGGARMRKVVLYELLSLDGVA